jgi:hypothetical protein
MRRAYGHCRPHDSAERDASATETPTMSPTTAEVTATAQAPPPATSPACTPTDATDLAVVTVQTDGTVNRQQLGRYFGGTCRLTVDYLKDVTNAEGSCTTVALLRSNPGFTPDAGHGIKIPALKNVIAKLGSCG